MKLRKLLPCIIFILIGVSSADFSSIDYVGTVTKEIYLEKNETNAQQVQRIIKQVCKSIYDPSITKDAIYDARQSIFTSIICSSFQDVSQQSIQEYLKRKTLSDTTLLCKKGQINENDPYCIPRSNNNKVDYNYIMLHIIKQVQNDRSNIGIVRAYGLQSMDSSQKKSDIANLYLAQYYGAIGKTPEAKDYPKTHKELIEYSRKSEKILQKLYFIDYKKVISQKEIIKKQYLLRNELFFQINTDQDAIVHAMYNELFFYNLFSSLYNEFLPNFWTDKTQLPDGFDIVESVREGIDFGQTQGARQRNAINTTTEQTIKEINNIQAAFPLHIGFLLYQEELFNLRKKLSIVYLPIHQLHYKLENVQSKN